MRRRFVAPYVISARVTIGSRRISAIAELFENRARDLGIASR
jgi:hypothetical protein